MGALSYPRTAGGSVRPGAAPLPGGGAVVFNGSGAWALREWRALRVRVRLRAGSGLSAVPGPGLAELASDARVRAGVGPAGVRALSSGEPPDGWTCLPSVPPVLAVTAPQAFPRLVLAPADPHWVVLTTLWVEVVRSAGSGWRDVVVPLPVSTLLTVGPEALSAEVLAW